MIDNKLFSRPSVALSWVDFEHLKGYNRKVFSLRIEVIREGKILKNIEVDKSG